MTGNYRRQSTITHARSDTLVSGTSAILEAGATRSERPTEPREGVPSGVRLIRPIDEDPRG